jgi:putative acetyltransferase
MGVTCEYPVPDEVFMVAELSPGALRGRRGLVRYSPDFAPAAD